MTYRSPSTPSTATDPHGFNSATSAASAFGAPFGQSMSSSTSVSGFHTGASSVAGPHQAGHNLRPPYFPGGRADSARYIEPVSPERESPIREQEFRSSPSFSEHSSDIGSSQSVRTKGHLGTQSQRRLSGRDEFDGPNQFLERPSEDAMAAQDGDLPHLPMNLHVEEQDQILSQVNGRLSRCAFDFVARYQFPVPIESDKRPVRSPNDREWTEWCFLLKRLATKRRIPARLLYNGQIKQLVTVLENSMEMRHAAAHQSRPPKDDRNVLQLISAGIQVTKLLKDAAAMGFLDGLYVHTERLIQSRKPVGAFST